MGGVLGVLWRAIRTLALVVIVLVGAASAVAYLLAMRSLPDYGGDRVVDGALAEIEIVRDARAVPHIFSKTEDDAFFALGYVHAQDRLWQMELRRRMAQGRLTELAGVVGEWSGRQEELISLDIAARALDLPGAAAASLETFSPSAKAALKSYADGVNAWLKVVDEEALGRGAPELLALGAEVEPWTPVDSVVAFKLLAASLSAHIFEEIPRARALARLGRVKAGDLYPDAAGPARLSPPSYEPASSSGRAPTEKERRLAALAEELGFPLGARAARRSGASNIWAAAGFRLATRAPLLASDPHLPLSAPGIWYVARMDFGDGPAIGATIPGVPAVLLGRNERIAWGAATLYSDVGDIFIEKIDPENPNRYRTPDGWAEFETREETIPIGGGRAVSVSIRKTRHGPVLPLDFPGVAAVTPAGHAPALSWTPLARDDRSLEAAMRLMRAKSVAEARRLIPLYATPAQTLVIGDRRNIGLFAIGRAPLRKPESVTAGRTPAKGWLAANDWAGWMNPNALPAALNPASGLVANTNNRIVDAPFPNHLGYDWPAPYRFQRLEKLLNQREYHTISGFRAIQNDAVSEMARTILPLMAKALWRDMDAESGARREALELLAAWTGEMDALSPAPLIFTAWTRALQRRILADDLGDLAEDFAAPRPRFLERVLRGIDGADARWCDDLMTPDAESCEALASAALDEALEELTGRYGSVIARWRWGKAHLAVHRHQPLGDLPVLGALFNISHETGGSGFTLRRGGYTARGEEPYHNVHAAGFRAVYDFADLDRSVFAIATGQSGHLLSRHYDDFAEIWRSGDAAVLSLERRDAEAGAVGVTRLRPE